MNKPVYGIGTGRDARTLRHILKKGMYGLDATPTPNPKKNQNVLVVNVTSITTEDGTYNGKIRLYKGDGTYLTAGDVFVRSVDGAAVSLGEQHCILSGIRTIDSVTHPTAFLVPVQDNTAFVIVLTPALTSGGRHLAAILNQVGTPTEWTQGELVWLEHATDGTIYPGQRYLAHKGQDVMSGKSCWATTDCCSLIPPSGDDPLTVLCGGCDIPSRWCVTVNAVHIEQDWCSWDGFQFPMTVASGGGVSGVWVSGNGNTIGSDPIIPSPCQSTGCMVGSIGPTSDTCPAFVWVASCADPGTPGEPGANGLNFYLAIQWGGGSEAGCMFGGQALTSDGWQTISYQCDPFNWVIGPVTFGSSSACTLGAGYELTFTITENTGDCGGSGCDTQVVDCGGSPVSKCLVASIIAFSGCPRNGDEIALNWTSGQTWMGDNIALSCTGSTWDFSGHLGAPSACFCNPWVIDPGLTTFSPLHLVFNNTVCGPGCASVWCNGTPYRVIIQEVP